MITLLASLAWGQSSEGDTARAEPSVGSDAALVTFGIVGGGAAGTMSGFVVGAIVARLLPPTTCDTTNGDCGSAAPAVIGGGMLLGMVTGATIGAVIAANKVHDRHVTVVPVGGEGPGLTLVGTF